MLYDVYFLFELGQRLTDDEIIARGPVRGELEFGRGKSGRYEFTTATIIGPDGRPLRQEMEYAGNFDHGGGRFSVRGFQRQDGVKDLKWRMRTYEQEWLCVLVPPIRS